MTNVGGLQNGNESTCVTRLRESPACWVLKLDKCMDFGVGRHPYQPKLFQCYVGFSIRTCFLKLWKKIAEPFPFLKKPTWLSWQWSFPKQRFHFQTTSFGSRNLPAHLTKSYVKSVLGLNAWFSSYAA